MTESFSSRLNVAMAFRNVKQIDFVHAAEKFNIKLGKSHMSQYVSGKTVPRADIAHFLAAFLQVNEKGRSHGAERRHLACNRV